MLLYLPTSISFWEEEEIIEGIAARDPRCSQTLLRHRELLTLKLEQK